MKGSAMIGPMPWISVGGDLRSESQRAIDAAVSLCATQYGRCPKCGHLSKGGYNLLIHFEACQAVQRKRGRPRIKPPREKKTRGGQTTTGRSKGPRVMVRFSDDEHQQIATSAGGAEYVAAYLRAKGLGQPWPTT